MLKLKIQYFGHLLQTANSLEKTLMQNKIEDKRRGWQKMKEFRGVTAKDTGSVPGSGRSPGEGNGNPLQ